jgi:ornithine cyclodeaminase
MLVLDRDEIMRRLNGVDLIAPIEQAFVAFSAGNAVSPMPGELILDAPRGDLHIKYGYMRGGAYIVVKIASGFYDNHTRGLPSSQGMMIVLDRETGVPCALLADEGALTDLRTAVAGAIAAKYLAPAHVDVIGVIGAGTQARLQVEQLQHVCACKNVIVWNRTPTRTQQFADGLRAAGYLVTIAKTPAEVCDVARLIVTTTPSESPIVHSRDVQRGTHITAIGADTPHKTELDTALFARATTVVTDSREQSSLRGELRHALAAGTVTPDQIIEIGTLIGHTPVYRDSSAISIAVLTGLAVQDIAIAGCVLMRP